MLLLAAPGLAQVERRPPNIVLLVADDLGFNDVGFHNAEVVTPNIDRVGHEGVRLERFYTAPKCSPTRAALLTGRYPIRWGLERDVIRQHHEIGLPPGEQTLPERLRKGGYGASMIVGKWHLGHAYARFHPLRQGFDRFLGNYLGQVDYYTHIAARQRDWHEGMTSRPRDDGKYHTDLVGAAAVEFVRRHADDPKPFLLYVPFLAPHEPKQAPADLIRSYSERGVPEPRATYLAKVTAMDGAIGSILEALDRARIAESTVVWFMSDNGGRLLDGASNAPLRGGKGIPWDGAIRVPSAIRYPAGDLPVGTVNEALITAVDVLPTLAGIAESAGAPMPPPARPLDGVDMHRVLQGRAAAPDKDHFAWVRLRASPREDYGVVTFADGHIGWKLLWLEVSLLDQPEARQPVRLYDLASDPGERRNVAGDHPEVVEALVAKLMAWRRLRPEATALLDTMPVAPPGWKPRPDWEFIDRPSRNLDDPVLLYRPEPDVAQQVRRVVADRHVERIATTLSRPDGTQRLVLGGIETHQATGTIYGLERRGATLYEISANGLLMAIGQVTGIDESATISALVAGRGDAQLIALDSTNRRLYEIDLAVLQAEQRALEADEAGVAWQIADLTRDSKGQLLGFDAATRRVVRIDEDGRATFSNFEYDLGSRSVSAETQHAVWLEDDEFFIVYRPSATGPELFRLDLARGGVDTLARRSSGRLSEKHNGE